MFKNRLVWMVLALLLALFTASQAFAGSCDQLVVPGMTDSQLIDLKKKCVDMAGNIAAVSTVDNMAEYAELGQKYGVALSEVAKSIGTTVNELAQTPVGRFMLVMVAYKVMGNDLLGIVGSVLWFTIMIPLWVYMFHRMVLSTRSVRETYDPTNSKLSKREIAPVNWGDAPGVIAIVMMFVMLFVCISGFFMAFG
jgi:hypothetical protein